MARSRGFFGFGSGDLSGVTAFATSTMSFGTDSPRTGPYHLHVEKTNPVDVGCGGQAAYAASGLAYTVAVLNGEAFDARFRVFLRVKAYPSANNHWLVGLFNFGSAFGPRLEMDTIGHVRMFYPSSSTTAYSGAVLPLDAWLRVEIRVVGEQETSGGANDGFFTASIDVYDEDDALLVGFSEDVVNYPLPINPLGGPMFGQNASGVAGTVSYDVDDGAFDLGSAGDAASVALPVEDHVFVVPITGQGAADDFTPAGDYPAVAELPKGPGGAGDQIDSSTLGATTTYVHGTVAGLGLGTIAAVAAWGNVDGSAATQALLLDGTEHGRTFSSATDDANGSTHRAFDYAAWSAARFDAMEFGARVKTATLCRLQNLWLEVLSNGNSPPTVDAGPDQTLENTTFAQLAGSASDPDGDPMTTTWSKISGPGTVSFDDATALDALATFSEGGTYVLQLEVDDGELIATDTVTIVIDASQIEFDPDDSPIGIAWVEFTDLVGALHKWAQVALPDPAFYFGGYKEPRVVEWGAVRRALSDERGQYEGSRASWTLSDVDRAIRDLLATETTRVFFNRSVVVRAIPDALRRLLKVPRTIFRGLVRNYQPLPSGLFRFEAEDYLITTFQIGTETEQVPRRVVTRDDFPDAPEEAIGAPVPIVYGELSDEDVRTVTIPGTPESPGVPGASVPKPTGVTATVVGPGGSRTLRYGVTALGPSWATRGDWDGANANVHVDETDPTYVEVTNAPDTDAEFGPSNYVEISWTRTADLVAQGQFAYRVYGRYATSPLQLLVHSTAPPYADGNPEASSGASVLGNPGIPGTSPPTTNNTYVEAVPGTPGTPDTVLTIDDGRGRVPVVRVGTEEISGTRYRRLLVCGHAVKEILGVYLDGVRQPDSIFGAGQWLVPGQTGWPFAEVYREIDGRRYTIVYVRENLQDANQDVQVTLNVRGVEDVGDGTGDLITSLPLQYLHALQNWLIGDYQSGAWLASPAFPDDPSLRQIDEASFSAAKTVSEARVSGGYVGAAHFGLEGDRVSLRDALARFNVSCDVRCGFNLSTQFIVSMLSEEVSQLASGVEVTQARDVIKDSFAIETRLEDFFNRVPYAYGRRPADGTWDAEPFVEDAASIAAIDETRTAVVRELWFVLDATIAEDVARRLLLISKEVPVKVRWSSGLAGMNFTLGDVVLLTHLDGVGAAGYVKRPIRVTRQDFHPGVYRVDLEGWDAGIFFEDAFILGDEASFSATWPAATSFERRYGYLCDETTGLFSDGSRGKRLR